MGGKQWKDRKHVLFYSACFLIIVVMSSGCVFPAKKAAEVISEKIQEQPPVHNEDPIELAANMMSKGDFDDALKAYGEIARNNPGDTPGDRALFDMGLIWAYPDNPKKNYEKALKYFRRLPLDYPDSSLKDEARAWTEVINKLIHYEGRVKKLEDEIISYQNQINALKEIDIGIEEKKRKGSPE